MMTDEQLTILLQSGGELRVPYFDDAPVRVEPSDVPLSRALPALQNFLRLTAAQRRADGRHLLAYCLLMMDAVDEEVIVEDLGGTMPALENIWEHASPTLILIGELDAGAYAAGPTTFVQIEGEVAWEPEHGLVMSWADGRRLVRVGPFDGHPTNGHASGKREDDRFVFCCYLPELCTLPDPA